MQNGKLLYRVSEAAEALGLSREMVYLLMARGQLRYVKIGAARRIAAQELERFVAERMAATLTGPQRER